MLWSFVCFVAACVAEAIGPESGVLYPLTLGVAALALSNVLWPNRVASLRERREKPPGF